MSINACSINEHTLNTLCGSRRQAIINNLLNLIPNPVQSTGGSQQHVKSDIRLPLTTFRREQEEEYVQTELSHVQVTIQFQDKVYSQTLEKTDSPAIINVYGLESNTTDESTDINISDIQIKVL